MPARLATETRLQAAQPALQAIAAGQSHEAAATAAHMHVTTLWRWRQAEPELRHLFDAALETGRVARQEQRDGRDLRRLLEGGNPVTYCTCCPEPKCKGRLVS